MLLTFEEEQMERQQQLTTQNEATSQKMLYEEHKETDQYKLKGYN